MKCVDLINLSHCNETKLKINNYKNSYLHNYYRLERRNIGHKIQYIQDLVNKQIT